jgi:hypothetical protein
MFVSQNDAGVYFGPQQREGAELGLSKAVHITTAESSFCDNLGTKPVVDLPDLGPTELIIPRHPIVEFPAIAVDGSEPVPFQFERHLGNNPRCFRIVLKKTMPSLFDLFHRPTFKTRPSKATYYH